MINHQIQQINYENIFDVLPFSIFIIDKSLKIEFTNLLAKEKFKVNLKNKNDIFLTNIFPGDSLIIDTIIRVQKEKKAISIEKLDLSNPFFSYTNADVYISYFDYKKTEKYIILISNEIFKNKNETLDLLNNKSLTGLSKMLTHEIKNPLSGIKGSAQLLSSDLSNDKNELMDIIISEVNRIEKIIDKVDYLFSNDLLNPESLNIHEIIDRAIKITQVMSPKTIKYEKYFDPSLPQIKGDKNILIQAFTNLIKNAVDAIDHSTDGLIRFNTYYSLWEPKAKYFGVEKRLTPIRIEITDNGKGVPESLKDTMFNPFVTSKNSGSGLGLTQVIGAMNSHEGKAEYLNSHSQTTFRLSFPELIL